jgi:steroid 5-alpha reductase family enzyme
VKTDFRIKLLFLSSMVPLTASAEPSASLSHLPFLWILAGAVSGLLAWLITRAIGRAGRLDSRPRFWGLAAILFALLLVFLSPIIVGLGSILISGRTM